MALRNGDAERWSVRTKVISAARTVNTNTASRLRSVLHRFMLVYQGIVLVTLFLLRRCGRTPVVMDPLRLRTPVIQALACAC
jgi:hypothetical protein